MRFRRKAVKVNTGPGLMRRSLGLFGFLRRPFLVAVLPAALLAGLCLFGLHLCRVQVASNPRYRVAAPKFTLRAADTPEWWERAFEDDINRTVAFADGTSILDEHLLEQVAQGCERCPWVQNVRFVAKEFPNRITADIDLRQPAAAVAFRTGSAVGYHLVGADGIRLPKEYASWPQRGLNVPYITGVAAAPPNPGEPWPTDSVANAIRIAERLKASGIVHRAINITAIDVSNYRGRRNPGQSEFLVVAENNCVIEWGRAPDTDRPGELPVEDKIAKLERYLTEGNPTSNRTLDLRFAGRVVVSRRYGTDGDSS